MVCILEGIQQMDQPGSFRRGEDVSLYEDVPDLRELWSRGVWLRKAEGDVPRPS
jgi:hypothetical protein